MNHNEQWRRLHGESSAFSRLALRLILGAFAAAALPAQLPADWYDGDAYPVDEVRAFAAGKWHVARLIPGGTSPQFVVDFEPGWPIQIPLEVTWGRELIALDSIAAKNQLSCRDLSSAVSRIRVEIYISSGWQALPGHPTYVPMPVRMRYTLPNVDRRSPVSVRASCEYEYMELGVMHFSGTAKIRFEPKDPLFGWNPGLPKDSKTFSIVDPDEGESMKPTTQFSARVKCSYCGSGSSITMEVEKATKYQTGTVGDLALPPGKPYVTEWKKIVTKQYSAGALSFDVNQVATLYLPGSLSEKSVRFGTVHHDTGWYRLRLVSSLGTTPWRTFQIYSPIPFMPKVMVSPLP